MADSKDKSEFFNRKVLGVELQQKTGGVHTRRARSTDTPSLFDRNLEVKRYSNESEELVVDDVRAARAERVKQYTARQRRAKTQHVSE